MYRNFQLDRGDHLIGYEWKGARPKAVVCLVHGIGEHAGRYDRIGEAFKENEIAMVGMDLRGHGLSLGKRGHTSPRELIFKDIDLLIKFTQDEYPDLPIFIYGHSMGGNITLDYRKRGFHRTVPQSFIVTSPWILLQRKIPRYLYLFSKMMATVKPDFLMNSEIKDEALGNRNIIDLQPNHHLRHGKISVKTALEGIEIGAALLDDSLKIRGSGPLRPFLLMQGDADKICDPEGSRRIAALEQELCTYIEWEGLYHEIHNGSQTSDGMDVIRTMIDWVKNSLQGRNETI